MAKRGGNDSTSVDFRSKIHDNVLTKCSASQQEDIDDTLNLHPYVFLDIVSGRTSTETQKSSKENEVIVANADDLLVLSSYQRSMKKLSDRGKRLTQELFLAADEAENTLKQFSQDTPVDVLTFLVGKELQRDDSIVNEGKELLGSSVRRKNHDLEMKQRCRDDSVMTRSALCDVSITCILENRDVEICEELLLNIPMNDSTRLDECNGNVHLLRKKGFLRTANKLRSGNILKKDSAISTRKSPQIIHQCFSAGLLEQSVPGKPCRMESHIFDDTLEKIAALSDDETRHALNVLQKSIEQATLSLLFSKIKLTKTAENQEAATTFQQQFGKSYHFSEISRRVFMSSLSETQSVEKSLLGHLGDRTAFSEQLLKTKLTKASQTEEIAQIVRTRSKPVQINRSFYKGKTEFSASHEQSHSSNKLNESSLERAAFSERCLKVALTRSGYDNHETYVALPLSTEEQSFSEPVEKSALCLQYNGSVASKKTRSALPKNAAFSEHTLKAHIAIPDGNHNEADLFSLIKGSQNSYAVSTSRALSPLHDRSSSEIVVDEVSTQKVQFHGDLQNNLVAEEDRKRNAARVELLLGPDKRIHSANIWKTATLTESKLTHAEDLGEGSSMEGAFSEHTLNSLLAKQPEFEDFNQKAKLQDAFQQNCLRTLVETSFSACHEEMETENNLKSRSIKKDASGKELCSEFKDCRSFEKQHAMQSSAVFMREKQNFSERSKNIALSPQRKEVDNKINMLFNATEKLESNKHFSKDRYVEILENQGCVQAVKSPKNAKHCDDSAEIPMSAHSREVFDEMKVREKIVKQTATEEQPARTLFTSRGPYEERRCMEKELGLTDSKEDSICATSLPELGRVYTAESLNEMTSQSKPPTAQFSKSHDEENIPTEAESTHRGLNKGIFSELTLQSCQQVVSTSCKRRSPKITYLSKETERLLERRKSAEKAITAAARAQLQDFEDGDSEAKRHDRSSNRMASSAKDMDTDVGQLDSEVFTPKKALAKRIMEAVLEGSLRENTLPSVDSCHAVGNEYVKETARCVTGDQLAVESLSTASAEPLVPVCHIDLENVGQPDTLIKDCDNISTNIVYVKDSEVTTEKASNQLDSGADVVHVDVPEAIEPKISVDTKTSETRETPSTARGKRKKLLSLDDWKHRTINRPAKCEQELKEEEKSTDRKKVVTQLEEPLASGAEIVKIETELILGESPTMKSVGLVAEVYGEVATQPIGTEIPQNVRDANGKSIFPAQINELDDKDLCTKMNEQSKLDCNKMMKKEGIKKVDGKHSIGKHEQPPQDNARDTNKSKDYESITQSADESIDFAVVTHLKYEQGGSIAKQPLKKDREEAPVPTILGDTEYTEIGLAKIEQAFEIDERSEEEKATCADAIVEQSKLDVAQTAILDQVHKPIEESERHTPALKNALCKTTKAREKSMLEKGGITAETLVEAESSANLADRKKKKNIPKALVIPYQISSRFGDPSVLHSEVRITANLIAREKHAWFDSPFKQPQSANIAIKITSNMRSARARSDGAIPTVGSAKFLFCPKSGSPERTALAEIKACRKRKVDGVPSTKNGEIFPDQEQPLAIHTESAFEKKEETAATENILKDEEHGACKIEEVTLSSPNLLEVKKHYPTGSEKLESVPSTSISTEEGNSKVDNRRIAAPKLKTTQVLVTKKVHLLPKEGKQPGAVNEPSEKKVGHFLQMETGKRSRDGNQYDFVDTILFTTRGGSQAPSPEKVQLHTETHTSIETRDAVKQEEEGLSNPAINFEIATGSDPKVYTLEEIYSLTAVRAKTEGNKGEAKTKPKTVELFEATVNRCLNKSGEKMVSIKSRKNQKMELVQCRLALKELNATKKKADHSLIREGSPDGAEKEFVAEEHFSLVGNSAQASLGSEQQLIQKEILGVHQEKPTPLWVRCKKHLEQAQQEEMASVGGEGSAAETKTKVLEEKSGAQRNPSYLCTDTKNLDSTSSLQHNGEHKSTRKSLKKIGPDLKLPSDGDSTLKKTNYSNEAGDLKIPSADEEATVYTHSKDRCQISNGEDPCNNSNVDADALQEEGSRRRILAERFKKGLGSGRRYEGSVIKENLRRQANEALEKSKHEFEIPHFYDEKETVITEDMKKGVFEDSSEDKNLPTERYLLLREKKGVQQKDEVPPGFLSVPALEITTSSSEPARIECELEDENDVVEWFINGKSYTSQPRCLAVARERMRSLLIRDLKPEDSGMIVVARLKEYAVVTRILIEDAHVEFKKALKRKTHGKKGESLTLAVTLGHPPKQVIWTKNGSELKDCEKYQMEVNGTSCRLTIKDADFQDAGQYLISADGSKSYTNVHIFGKPSINKNVEGAVELKRGEDIMLCIKFDCPNEPLVSCFFNGSRLREDANINVDVLENQVRVSKQHATKVDSGEYVIKLSNEFGEDSLRFEVKVRDVPGSPSTISVDKIESDSLALSWKKPVDSGEPPITGYIVEMKEDNCQTFHNIAQMATATPFHRPLLAEPSIITSVTNDSCVLFWQGCTRDSSLPKCIYEMNAEPIYAERIFAEGPRSDAKYEFKAQSKNEAGAGLNKSPSSEISLISCTPAASDPNTKGNHSESCTPIRLSPQATISEPASITVELDVSENKLSAESTISYKPVESSLWSEVNCNSKFCRTDGLEEVLHVFRIAIICKANVATLSASKKSLKAVASQTPFVSKTEKDMRSSDHFCDDSGVVEIVAENKHGVNHEEVVLSVLDMPSEPSNLNVTGTTTSVTRNVSTAPSVIPAEFSKVKISAHAKVAEPTLRLDQSHTECERSDVIQMKPIVEIGDESLKTTVNKRPSAAGGRQRLKKRNPMAGIKHQSCLAPDAAVILKDEFMKERQSFGIAEIVPSKDCSAESEEHGSSEEIKLKSGPSVEALLVEEVLEKGRPRIQVESSREEAKSGEGVTLKVGIYGETPLRCEWSKDGKPIKASRNLTTSFKDGIAQLTIKEVDLSHSGIYVVSVSNAHGTDTAQVALAVTSVPSAPEGPLGTSVVGSSCKLSWGSPVEDGHSKVLRYCIEEYDERTMDWSFVAQCTENVYTVDHLPIGSSHRFRVFAENSVGRGNPIESEEVKIVQSSSCGSLENNTASGMLQKSYSSAELSLLHLDKPSVTSVGDSVVAAWKPLRLGDDVGYVVEVKEADSKRPWETVTAEPISGECYIIKGLDPEGSYVVRVSAVTSGVRGAPSEESDVVTCGWTKAEETPILISTPNDITVMKGLKTKAVVEFSGFPVPEVQWKRNSKEIFSGTRRWIETSAGRSTLFITDVRDDDEAEYTVLLRNASGECEHKFKLIMDSQPEIIRPDRYTSTLVYDEGDNVKLRLSFTGTQYSN